MDTLPFLDGKRTNFSKVKEIKGLRGDVSLYAVQVSVQIDAEIGGRCRFRMKINYDSRKSP